TSMIAAPSARNSHTAVWTGTRMIVFGGTSTAGYFNSGGIYDPLANSWTATSTAGAPDARANHVALWTGQKMLIWGGFGQAYYNSGASFDPANNSWSAPMTTANAPGSRQS